MQQLQRLLALIALSALAFALAPVDRAWACSCSEPSIEELLEREPDAAVVRIRRIDTDGGVNGVGHVEEVLHGTDLPEQLPLALDDGGSCLPWVAVGDLAVLAFVPDHDGWRTIECGRMDPTTGLDPVAVDPTASEPAAVVVAGRFPGSNLLALDDQLRILAADTLEGASHGMRPCGSDLLVPLGGANGERSLALVRPTDLAVIDEHPLSVDPRTEVRILAASCDGDRVDVLVGTEGADPEIHLHRDVFGSDLRVALAPATDAAFVGDDVLLLREAASGDGSVLVRHDVATNASRTLLDLEGTTGYEISAAPDTGHALIRGFAEEPVLIVVDLTAERERARATGWWQPVYQPWLHGNRILQIDEDAGGIGGTGLAQYRIVDLDLTTITTLEPTPAWHTATGHDAVLQIDGDSLTVTDDAGDRIRSTAHPWAAGVHDAVLLGTILPAGDVQRVDLPAVDPSVARDAASSNVTRPTGLGPAIGVMLFALAAVALAVAIALHRREPHADGD